MANVKTIGLWVAAALLMMLAGGCGMGCVYLGAQAYADHQLLNEIRASRQQELLNAAQQVQQFQQSQQQQQGAAPKPTP
jgi:hypothetical protein